MANKQKKLSRALKKQTREIELLKKEAFGVYEGFGKSKIMSFPGFSGYPHDDTTQKEIQEGYYKSVEDFDSIHTADIEFIVLYEGKNISKYRNKTKNNLVELGKCWRERIKREHPDADITIIVHQNDGEWFLDTFNYALKIEGGIYI